MLDNYKEKYESLKDLIQKYFHMDEVSENIGILKYSIKKHLKEEIRKEINNE